MLDFCIFSCNFSLKSYRSSQQWCSIKKLLLNLIWVGGNFSPFWFYLNNSEMVKATNLIRAVCTKFGIPYSPQFLNIGQNLDEGIYDFQISGQFLIKRNCHNSWTTDDVDMKLGNKTMSKKFDNDVMSESCVKSLPFFQFMANLEQSGSWIPDA